MPIIKMYNDKFTESGLKTEAPFSFWLVTVYMWLQVKRLSNNNIHFKFDIVHS